MRQLRSELLQRRTPDGHWEGRLSDSALATATAVSALALYRKHALWPIISRHRLDELIHKGIRWIINRQNRDGGWGDTAAGHSNIATTMLVRAAVQMAGDDPHKWAEALRRGEQWCAGHAGGTTAGDIAEALRRRYGADRTFAVPILANCAMAGLVPWNLVPSLPFEAVLVPQRIYRFIQLPVVSYAIPALVAIGQARYFNEPPRNPLTRMLRRLSVDPGLRLLEQMQPASGGFLEATPLTSFVGMSLAHTGRADHGVTKNCIQFIVNSFRDSGDEGSWPIDTNLATWNTTLAINALGDNYGDDNDFLSPSLLDWLLACQHNSRHPFTGSDPGGWGWSDLSGAVPDADDTSGALLALRHWWNYSPLLPPQRKRIEQSAVAGVNWLLQLQNRDGGWPTFCRGWGRLPFDRSGTDITAHVIRALLAWKGDLPEPAGQRRWNEKINAAIDSGLEFLARRQNEDGSWSPLWFGNQDHPNEDNPVYGTARVLAAWRDAGQIEQAAPQRGLRWLLDHRNADGGWGGGSSRPATVETGNDARASTRISSVQETSLAVEILASCQETRDGGNEMNAALGKGIGWLIDGINRKEHHERWPIGFYFARLWYDESLYPLLYSAAALGSVVRQLRSETRSEAVSATGQGTEACAVAGSRQATNDRTTV